MGSPRRRILPLGLLLIGSFLLAGLALTASSNVDWRMLQHDSQRIGLTEGVGPSNPEVLFEYETAYWVRSSCLVAPDGAVLVGSYMGSFYCLEPDTDEMWPKWYGNFGTDIEGTPCLSPDGLLYLPLMDGRLVCIDSNTSASSFVDQQWVYSGSSPLETSPCLTSDGAVVATWADGTLVVINREGSTRWAFSSEAGFEASPAVAYDGAVIAADADGVVTALDSDGTVRWTYNTMSQVRAAPTAYFDTVYVISYDGVVHALSLQDGTAHWTFASGCLNIGSSAAIDNAGALYFGTQEGYLFALYQHGAEKWRYEAAGEITSSPAVDADGKVFFGCSDYCLYCVNDIGHLVWKLRTRGMITASPAIGPAEPFEDLNGNGVCDGDEVFDDVNENLRWDGNCIYVGSWDRKIIVVGDKEDKVPILSDGKVFPEQGGISTVFTFSVGYYSDPSSSPERTRVVIDGSPYTMTLYREDYYGPGIDEYRFETQLPVGEHDFYFSFRDLDGDSVRLPTDGTFSGPLVGPDNRPPDLQRGYVSPASAALGSSFRFTVEVTDADEDLITGVYLALRGPGMNEPEIVEMTETGATDEYFTYSYSITLLNVGEYEYIFGALDKRDGLGLLPSEGWFHGPTVTVSSSAWPMYRQNRNHTGLSLLEGPFIHKLKWSQTANAGIVSSPCVGASGNIYVGSLNGSLYAYSPEGQQLWSYASGDKIATSPAAGYQDVVYFGSDDGFVYAVQNGTLLWRTETGGNVRSSPVLGSGGQLYIGSNDGYLYALSKDTGEMLWRYNIGAWINTSPAVWRLADRDIIYVTAMDQNLYAVHNLDSAVDDVYCLKLFHTGHWITSSPCVGPDGTIYFGSNDGNLYAVDQEGNLVWSYTTGSWVRSSPALDMDGNVYVGSLDHKLYCVKPDGKLKWAVDLGDQIIGSCALDSRGFIYIGTNLTTAAGGKVYCLDRNGETEWVFQTYDAVNSSPAIGGGNMVYFGSLDHNLYAYGGRDEIAPYILSGGFWNSVVTASGGGTVRLTAEVYDPEDNVEYVELYEMGGDSLDLYLLDNGLGGDQVAGDGIFTIQMGVAPGEMESGRHDFELIARDRAGNRSEIWPYLEVRSEGIATRSCSGDPFVALREAGFTRILEPAEETLSPATAAPGTPLPLASNPYNANAPYILNAGYGHTRLTVESGGHLSVFARVGDAQGLSNISRVQFRLFYLGVYYGVDLADRDGDGVYTLDVDVGSGIVPRTYLVDLRVFDRQGNMGSWPSLTVWD